MLHWQSTHHFLYLKSAATACASIPIIITIIVFGSSTVVVREHTNAEESADLLAI